VRDVFYFVVAVNLFFSLALHAAQFCSILCVRLIFRFAVSPSPCASRSRVNNCLRSIS
jgi:hypothetical protein